MTDDEHATAPEERPESEELSKFTKLARALFRVDKRDVPKHEPKKRDRSRPPVAND